MIDGEKMAEFSFGNIKTTSKKQILDLKLYDNPVLADKSTVEAPYSFVPTILTDEHYNPAQVKAIEKFLTRIGMRRYRIISAVNCEVNARIIKADGKIKFYKNNRTNFYDYIPQYGPIITVGAALYSVILEDDVFPSYVQQIFFGKTNFWFSEDLTREKGHWIYPIESFRLIFAKGFVEPVDSYKTKLAQIQINQVIVNPMKLAPRLPKLIKHRITTKEQFLTEFWEPCKDKKNEVLAWDTETSGLVFMKDRVGCITLSFDGREGWYIRWSIIEENPDCKEKLREILKNNRQCGANLKFDCKFLWKAGLPEARIDEDVIALGHSLEENRSNSLKTLAFFYSEYGGYERPLDIMKDKMGKGEDISYIDDIPEDVLWDYAVMDAIVTRRVFSNLMVHAKELDKKYPNYLERSTKGLVDYYYERRIPAENMYSIMEYEGVYVDKAQLDKVREEANNKLAEIRSGLENSFGIAPGFDWTSNPKLGKLLESQGWEELGRSEAGDYLVGDFQLTRWAKNHPEAKILQEMKSIQTIINTFLGSDTKNSVVAEFLGENDEKGDKGWTKCLVYHPEDNTWRMHPNFRPMFADSGRSRCVNPNMQQVPTHSDWATKVKKCIQTPNNDEYYLCTIDYSSLQLRLASIDSYENDFLREVLRRPGADIHCATAYTTLAQGRKFDVMNVHVERGSQSVDFLGEEVVFTENRGSVFAKDLTEEDTLKDFYFKGESSGNTSGCKITKTNEFREITEEELKRQKKGEPYEELRRLSKSENFLLIFGGSPKVLSDSALETFWDEDACDDFIERYHCEKELEQAKKSYKNECLAKQKNIAVCMRLRSKFFEGYPGLWHRIGREKEIAAEKGYVRTVFGKVRNLIELFLRGSYDDETMSGTLRNLENICANHAAQNLESCIRGKSQYETQQWLKRNGYKTRPWSEIHDSADFFLKKTEIKPVLAHIKHIFERVIPELKDDWVPLIIDCEISDLNAGDFYKHGRDPEDFGVDWESCKYEDPDPFNVELSNDLEDQYFKERAQYWEKKGEKDPLEDKIRSYLENRA